jgi:hypothetical protein
MVRHGTDFTVAMKITDHRTESVYRGYAIADSKSM